jgi:hypothetical protein
LLTVLGVRPWTRISVAQKKKPRHLDGVLVPTMRPVQLAAAREAQTRETKPEQRERGRFDDGIGEW